MATWRQKQRKIRKPVTMLAKRKSRCDSCQGWIQPGDPMTGLPQSRESQYASPGGGWTHTSCFHPVATERVDVFGGTVRKHFYGGIVEWGQ